MVITFYFRSNSNYTLICMKKHSGNGFGTTTEPSVYSVPYAHFYSQSGLRKMKGDPGLAALYTPTNSFSRNMANRSDLHKLHFL